jgi:hypothetical protein
MVAAIWAAIGLMTGLVATLLVLVVSRLDALNARMDVLGQGLNARIDATNVRLEAMDDRLTRRLDRQGHDVREVAQRMGGVETTVRQILSRLTAHEERHAG